jgi:hypothetical protein
MNAIATFNRPHHMAGALGVPVTFTNFEMGHRIRVRCVSQRRRMATVL